MYTIAVPRLLKINEHARIKQTKIAMEGGSSGRGHTVHSTEARCTAAFSTLGLECTEAGF